MRSPRESTLSPSRASARRGGDGDGEMPPERPFFLPFFAKSPLAKSLLAALSGDGERCRRPSSSDLDRPRRRANS